VKIFPLVYTIYFLKAVVARGEGKGGMRPGRHFQGAAFQGQPKNLELNFSVSTPLCTTTVVLPLPPSYILQSDTAQLVWYSRYFEVRMMKTITSTKIIQSMSDISATHGLCMSLRTDNAQCFVSQEFTDYLKNLDI